eukprot:PITA_04654
MISRLRIQLEEIKNISTRDLKREFQQKQQEIDRAFAKISRITQQMQEVEIERTESNQRYISIVYQKKKELETSSVEISRHADEGGSVDDHKSTSGVAFYLGGCLVSWLSKKQTSISLSTVEEEYITTAACCTQVLWMKQTLQDLQVKFDEPIPIFFDNTSAISISKNPVIYSKTKHILIKYHFVREKVIERNIKLEYVGTKEQIADIFTKPLPHEAFEYLR